MLDDSFGKLARSTQRNKFVTVTHRSTPFYPDPLPGIDEERLIRERVCDTCQLRYAVYGEHRYCPVCGPRAHRRAGFAFSRSHPPQCPPHELPAETLRPLRETGVLDRTYADTVKNVVDAVESLAERASTCSRSDAHLASLPIVARPCAAPIAGSQIQSIWMVRRRAGPVRRSAQVSASSARVGAPDKPQIGARIEARDLGCAQACSTVPASLRLPSVPNWPNVRVHNASVSASKSGTAFVAAIVVSHSRRPSGRGVRRTPTVQTFSGS